MGDARRCLASPQDLNQAAELLNIPSLAEADRNTGIRNSA